MTTNRAADACEELKIVTKTAAEEVGGECIRFVGGVRKQIEVSSCFLLPAFSLV